MNINDGLIKNLPLPILGLSLGIISLGNFYKDYSVIVEVICAVIGIVLISRTLIKFVTYPAFYIIIYPILFLLVFLGPVLWH